MEMTSKKYTRNMHYISQCYLAPFTSTGTKDGQLWVCDSLEKKTFHTKPRNVGAERDFNKVELTGYEPDVLEKSLAVFEGKAASVISEIINKNSLPQDNEFAYIVNMICLFVVHHPVMRKVMNGMRIQTVRIIEDMLRHDKRLYESTAQQAYRNGFLTEAEAAVPFEQVMKGQYRIEVPTNTSLEAEFRAFESCLSTFGARHWTLLTAAKEAPDFITCDRPTTLAFKKSTNETPGGYAILNTELVFPIGPRHALLGVFEDPLPQNVECSLERIAEINMRVIDRSYRQIYSRDSKITVFYEGKFKMIDLDAKK